MRPHQDGRREVWDDQDTRNALCSEKDKIIRPLLERALFIADPKKFHAILMPALSGPEVQILKSQKVPGRNIWAIEGDARRHRLMKAAVKDPNDMLYGINLTRKKMDSGNAMAEIEFEAHKRKCKFGLIYVDYFSQPSLETLDLLGTVFFGRLLDLKNGAHLVMNFGVERTDECTSHLNRMLPSDNRSPCRKYVEAKLHDCKERGNEHPVFVEAWEKTYKGIKRGNGARPNYVTSVFIFKGEVKTD